MTTSTVTPEIVEFAQGVRAALADLPAEEVDDLTEGLEADLAEAYAEDLQRELPDPVAYATELRSAAGLPQRAKGEKSGVLAGLSKGWKDTRADLKVAIRRNPALASALDFLVSLRPVWWITRAWLAAWLVAAFFGFQRGQGFDGDWWLVFVAFVVISVQWGRGRWHLPRGMGPVLFVGNLVAAIVAIPVLAYALDDREHHFYETEPAATQDLTGVYLNGSEVTNIFGYDSTGKRLENIQLFDQDGKPLATSVPGGNGCLDPDCNETGAWTPSVLESGQTAWNVFPMRMVKMVFDEQTGEDKPDPTARAEDRDPPYAKVPAVQLPEKVAKSDK